MVAGADGRVQLAQPLGRVADDGERAVLDRVEPRGVEGDQPGLGVEHRPGRGGEVLEPRAHGQHQVGAAGERVGRGGAGDAQRPGVQRVVVRDEGAAGGGLRDRDAVRLGELHRDPPGPRVADAAAEHEQRPAGGAQGVGRLGDLPGVGAGPRHPVDDPAEQRGGEVVDLGLHVLRQRQHDRTALGRVGEDPGDLGQGGDELFGPGDPVEVAADRAERVVDRARGIAEVLDLLEHRVRGPVDEGVAGQQQDGQPVGVRDAGRGDHVQRAGADRGGGDADLPAVGRPGHGHGRQRHALLVVPAPGRQRVAVLVEGGAHAEHVAVPEDREHAGEQRGPSAPSSSSVRWATSHRTRAWAVVRRTVLIAGLPGRARRPR
nr:hypothetical protein GCM10020241_39810 [Streptoalloteichus tenebrarius]